MDESTKAGLNIALTEADWLDIRLDQEARQCDLVFSVLTLPNDTSPMPENRRRTLRIRGISRLAASLRHGAWDDETAEAEPFPPERLGDIVRSFGGQPIDGNDYFSNMKNFDHWRSRLSMDFTCGSHESNDSLYLFQDEVNHRILELMVWFRELEILDSEGEMTSIPEFIDGGRRYWKALFSRDPRVLPDWYLKK